MDHFVLREGVLHAEALPLPALAERYGTPLYVYSRATLERHYRAFDDALAAVHRALQMSAEDLDARMVDWADWDDAAAFAADGGEDFEQSNLGVASMRTSTWLSDSIAAIDERFSLSR